MARFEIVDTFTKFLERAPEAMRAAGVRGAQKAAPRLLGRMQSAAPRLTGAMASRLTADGGVVGIFNDPEEASVALYNEYSPNHQPFLRPSLQATEGDLVSGTSEEIAGLESELAE